MNDHECTFPWEGALQQCLTCKVWWKVVEYRNDETGETWKSWEKVDK